MHLNNKGFAISGVLYSMLILIVTLMFLILGILAGRRTTLNKISSESQESVEERFEEIFQCTAGTSVLYTYDADELEQTVELTPGYYLIQAWGAAGATYKTSSGTKRAGGKGAYVSAIYQPTANQTLYLNLGDNKLKSSVSSYNGGGASKNGASGGGATSIATVSGELSTLEEQKESILLVAAGGGGGSYQKAGGAGGDLVAGVNGNPYNTNTTYIDYRGMGATAEAGGAGGKLYSGKPTSVGQAGGFGFGGAAGYASSSYPGGGGGSGYYGGGGGSSATSSSVGSGGGGVSYIHPDLLAQTQDVISSSGIVVSSKIYSDYIGVGINGNSEMPDIEVATDADILSQVRTGNDTTGAVRITKLTCQTYRY